MWSGASRVPDPNFHEIVDLARFMKWLFHAAFFILFCNYQASRLGYSVFGQRDASKHKLCVIVMGVDICYL